MTLYNVFLVTFCICISVCVHAKSLQLCPTLCDLMDSRPPELLLNCGVGEDS